MRTRNIFILLIFLVAILWLFFSKGETAESKSELTVSQETNSIKKKSQLSSAIKPIKIIEIEDNANQRKIDNDDRKEIQGQFKQATEYLLKEQWEQAENIYLNLIKKVPLAIESYINLASVYAQTNRLDEARKLLLQGVEANQNYSILFENLQSIHGALAAQAYRSAFVTEEGVDMVVQSQTTDLDLPLINSIDLRLVDLGRQQRLSQQVLNLLKAQREERQTQQKSDSRIIELETQLASVNTRAQSLSDNSVSRVVELEEKLQQKELQLELKTKRISLIEEELIAVKQQVDSQLVASNALVSEPTSNIEVISEPENIKVVPTTNKQDKVEIASSLVKSWADSWSKQDVGGYISHYIKRYRPTKTELTNAQWVAQRKVRLTNKKFIQVDVSNLVFQEEGDQFSVVFIQRYRSNTIDDTIRKKLVFKANASDYKKSKIIDEVVITN